MKKEIEKIAEQEAKICRWQEYLYISFFVAAIIVLGIICWTFFVSKESNEVKGIRAIITLSAFVASIILGYFYHQRLSKRLYKLGEQKKVFI